MNTGKVHNANLQRQPAGPCPKTFPGRKTTRPTCFFISPMTEYEEKSKFLNEVAFAAMFTTCKPTVNEPFFLRFLRVQSYVRRLYITFLVEDMKTG